MAVLLTLEEFTSQILFEELDWFKLPVNPLQVYSPTKDDTGYRFSQQYITTSGKFHWLFNFSHVDSHTKDLCLVGEPTHDRLIFSGAIGWSQGCKTLDNACDTLFGQCGIKVRNITMDDFEMLHPILQEIEGSYHLSSQFIKPEESLKGTFSYFGLYRVCNGVINGTNFLTDNFHNSYTNLSASVRPIIFLPHISKDIKILVGTENNGKTPTTAFEIVFANDFKKSLMTFIFNPKTRNLKYKK